MKVSKELALRRAADILAREESRYLIGIFGKPGVGKTTFTEFLATSLSHQEMQVVSMDGFHLSNSVLESRNLRNRKGAPETFDVNGFATLLNRINSAPYETIYYPIFDRTLEESIAAQGVISPHTKLVVVEGNYLALDEGEWTGISGYFDELWYLELPDEERIPRLIARHIAFGKSPDFAREWALGTDERNAELIGRGAGSADLIVTVD